ncbi:MAG: DUF1501 domain-containing protein [Planctomycetaceae bacterium]
MSLRSASPGFGFSRASRRGMLQIGALGAGGPCLTQLLRAESAANIRDSRKAIINIHLDGGPPHLDSIDPKPEAPVEIRGEFDTIATSLPGVHVTELLPRIASIADKLVFIRSLTGSAGAHDAFQCQSGYAAKDLESLGGRPAVGCVVSKLLGRSDDPAPAFIDLMQGRPQVRNSARPGFLGPATQPFRPDISGLFRRVLEPGMQNELKRLGQDHSVSLTLNPRLTAGRIDDRQALLASLDRLRRDADRSGMMEAMDQFDRQAVGILLSGALARALDLSTEDPQMLQRYTAPASASGRQSTTSEGPESIRKFLLARRLIEAGVRYVSVSISDFDTHSDNFPRMRNLLPIVDHGLHALITDLEERGMLDDVSIVVWGEFGRTPRIDPKTGGRHHWPQAGPALLAGGGLKTGQVIGSTDRLGDEVASRPVTYKDIFATLYRCLGIDARTITLPDPQGRPQFLLDDGQPLSEV